MDNYTTLNIPGTVCFYWNGMVRKTQPSNVGQIIARWPACGGTVWIGPAKGPQPLVYIIVDGLDVDAVCALPGLWPANKTPDTRAVTHINS